MMSKFFVEDPATGEIIGSVADAGPVGAAAAVDAAALSAGEWANTPALRRSEILYRAFELMGRDRDQLADLIVAENGKSRRDARAEVVYAAEFFRWYAAESVRLAGSFGPSPEGGTRTVVTRRPVGIAALITPWNFPAAMITRKVAPALAAGCTTVLKPARETPLTALAIASLLIEAGVPTDVVNVVTTSDAQTVVTTWLDDPRVRKLSFTGSTETGRRLLRQAADRVVNASMELGGNAAFVVAGDADVDAAVAGAMIAKFRNGGQACTAANRFYVHAEVARQFVVQLGEQVAALRVGPGSDPQTDVGPLINAKAVDGVSALVESALADGARITSRSQLPPDGKGHFYPPTVLTDVSADAEIVQQEIFGPVAPIVTWDDEDELVRRVNESELGLAAYVYAGDTGHAIRLGEALDAGMVGINRGLVSAVSAPFGGVKQSGLGREGGRDGLEAFTEIQYLSVDWPGPR